MPVWKSRFSALAAIVVTVLTAACAGDPTTPTEMGSQAARQIGSAGETREYEIAPGDRLRVNVFGDTTLNGEYGVDQTGALPLPLVGSVPVAGHTTNGAAGAIASALKSGGFLRDPRVSVEVINFRPFYILGEVNRPGEYPYKAGMSLFAAVATAGGYTYRANSGKVYIRKGSEGVEREYELTSDIAILPGDVIRIPERYF